MNFENCETVVHLAANASVRNGWDDPYRDITDGPFLTVLVLEGMRKYGVQRLVFSSSGSVYAPANAPRAVDSPLYATSLYAASKIACEELIHAYEAAGHIEARILRLVSVLGPGLRRGLIYDFVQKLRKDPHHLGVLAPGTSRKSYVYVSDVCTAILTAGEKVPGTYNVATTNLLTPMDIAEMVVDITGTGAIIHLEGETWIGDNPYIALIPSFPTEYSGWQAVVLAASYAWNPDQ